MAEKIKSKHCHFKNIHIFKHYNLNKNSDLLWSSLCMQWSSNDTSLNTYWQLKMNFNIYLISQRTLKALQFITCSKLAKSFSSTAFCFKHWITSNFHQKESLKVPLVPACEAFLILIHKHQILCYLDQVNFSDYKQFSFLLPFSYFSIYHFFGFYL